jgi:hypothetical protein
MDVCPNCGTELPVLNGGAFCAHCGARVLLTASSDRAHDDTVTLPALRPGPVEPKPYPMAPKPYQMTQIIPVVAPELVDDPVPLPPRVSRSVITAVGVAVVAVAVIAVSLVTLDGGGKSSAAQVPSGRTEVVTPTVAVTSTALGNGEPVAPNDTSATPASSSSSAGPRPGPLTGAGSGRCVDIPGANPVDGTQLVLFRCNNTAAQSWTYVDGTVRAMGKCLDVRGGASLDRTPVQIFACNGSAAQQWRYDPQSGELHTLGKCLDASGAGTGDRTPLILYTCHQADNQKWHMAP